MSTTIKNAEATSKTHLHNIMQIAVFGLNDKNLYGINISKIRSIEDYKKFTIIKNNTIKSEYLEGYIEYQSKVVPIISIEKWLGIYTKDNIYYEYLVCDFNRTRVAFPISGIRNIFNVQVSDLQKSDAMFDAITYDVVVEVDGGKKIVLVLDVEKLLFDTFGASYEIPTDQVTKNKKLLIAEDSRTAQEIIKDILKTSAIEYEIFNDGLELISYLENLEDISSIGLVITDLEMPRKDGYQVIKAIKENARLKEIPVVVNTSMSDQGVTSKTIALGASGFVAKTDPVMFLDAIERYMV